MIIINPEIIWESMSTLQSAIKKSDMSEVNGLLKTWINMFKLIQPFIKADERIPKELPNLRKALEDVPDDIVEKILRKLEDATPL